MKIFLLEPDLSYLRDYEFHAELVKLENSSLMPSFFMGTNDFDHPSPFVLQGDLKTMETIDVPYTNLGDTLFSKRMVEQLLKLRIPRHRLMETSILDDTYLEPFEKTGGIKADVPRTSNFIAIHLQEHTHALDLEASEFKMSKAIPGKISIMRKLVLKEPPGGFPVLFRIQEYKRYLFLSEEGKKAIDSIEANGYNCKEVEVSS